MSVEPLYLTGRSWALQDHQRVCACVSVCVCGCVWERSISFGRVPLVWNAKPVCGCSCSRYPCVSLHSCTEVARCEIRWWFVEGDNEQSATLTGWALSCELQSVSPPTDFNQRKLVLFLKLWRDITSHFSVQKLSNKDLHFMKRFRKCE